ncbi:ATP-dependent nuclease [Pseudomonas fluorescens]|uniref:ATP-dependent nuclease n=1 Tax=Pseudomonas fluorescens TaxID=294 RepID=UPI001651A75D|nr:ATP-binding protein [Pseudomonas fluorescens]
MQKCTLKSLEIEQPPFRKLKNLTIEFAERITLIAGHNGIGKSTILALVANGSGLTTKKYSSYTGKLFRGLLNEIIHIDYEKEFLHHQEKETLPSPILEYEINGERFQKRCALSKRSVENKDGETTRLEARVVPRNKSNSDFSQPDQAIKIGVAAKVPIPTMYLGMTRMIPIGESDPELVVNILDTGIDQSDADFITSFVYSVISIDESEELEKSITTQAIQGTNKVTKHPSYGHSPKSVSLGQDSLSAIATALASFKKLQREWENYPGGILVIDEIDAGFHPHAQQKLIASIGQYAKKFRIQVIATTHSLCMIEAVHPENNPIGGRGVSPDSIVYLTDTVQPRVMTNPSLDTVRNDMLLIPPKMPSKVRAKAKYLKIYLEDAEANFFLKCLLTPKLKKRIKEACGVTLKPIPISVGCNNLQGLQTFDPHFKTVLIVVDADATVKNGNGKLKNVVKLPGGKISNGVSFSPERTIYEFAKTLMGNNQTYPTTRAKLVNSGITSNQIQVHLMHGNTDITKREPAKRWWNERIEIIEDWKLVDHWLEEHPELVETFEKELMAAAIYTAKLTI